MVEVGNVAVGAVVLTYVLAHVVYALATIFTVFGGKLFGLRNVEHMIFPHVPSFLFQLISGLVSLCASLTWAVAVVFFSLIPFVVLCFFLTLVHMNHARIAAFVVSTYNEHIGGSDTLQFFRHGLWLLKLAGESLVPVYNLLVSAITGGTYEILNVLVGNIRMQESMTSLVLGLGQLMRTIMAAGAQWVTRNWSECAQTPALVAQIVASEDTHRCLENGPGLYRALDLSVVAGDMALVVEQAVLVFVRVCPAVQAAVFVLMHPLLDSNLVLFVENMANALVTAAYTAWDVTHLRCRAVQLLPRGQPRARTSLCVPDVAPVFLFASEASSALGRLVDNWATRAMRYALSFFFVPDGTDTGTCASVFRDADIAELTAVFAPDASTRVLAVTDKLTAGTDGTSVVFHEALSNATYASAFAHPVDLRAGLAPVALLPDPRFADLDGNTQTALMGCRCDATAGVRIRCEIAPFSTSPLLEGDVAATTVELSFESETTNDFFASCADLSISVQPLRFPARSMPPDTAQRLFYGASGADASATACVRDPRACSTVDAAVYVMPLCRGTNIEAHTRCIEGLDQMRCFPYCVGLHQRDAGTKPMILHSYDSLRSGVFLTNTNCAPALATAQTSSTALPLLTDSLYADLSAPGSLHTMRRTLAPTDPIDAARDYDCILRPAAARSSAARDAAQARAARARLFAETTSPSEFQPVVFAGDTVLTPFCNEYSGAGGATWSCDWSVNLERVTSALNNRYAIADVRTRVPASRELPPQQSRMLPLPGRHAASLAGLQVSAQLPDGVVYAINPYYDEFRCLITSTPCFGVTSGRLQSPALFVARPHLQCSSTPEVMLQHTTAERVLLCAGDMARRVTWDDAADGFVDEAALARQDVRTYKLYIEHVSYYNARNVLVAVRRGPARELKYELGYDTRPSAHASACHTAFYFVDTETLRAARGQPWRSASEYHAQAFDREIGCLQDPLLPPLGMLGARASQVAITAARVLGNSFVLNGVGLVEELLTQQPATEGLDAKAVPLRLCHNAFGHGAFEPCSVLPLSVSPIHASVVRLFAHWRLVVRRFVVYVQVLTGFGFGPGQWFENLLVAGAEPDASVLQAATEGVAAAGAVSFGAVLGVLSSSVHVSFYVVEDVGLAYVRAALRYMRTRQIREVFLVDLSLMFPGTVYNSLHNNAYDNMVRAPGLALCSKLAHATGDPTLPMGVFAYHACSAGFELHRASLQFFAGAFSMLGVAECACRNVNAERIDELSHRCFARIPDAYRATFDQHVQTHSFSHEVCMAQIATVEAELNNAPADFFLHVDRAVDALRGVPQQLAQYMRLPVFSEATCASYTTAVETSVMLPRPVAEFRRCALTQTCLGRCTRAIAPFFEAMARVQDGGGSPHRLPLQRDVDFPLRPWVSADAWHPVAVQLFARAGPRGCDYFKVVFAARAVDGGRNVEWRVSCLCFAKDTGVLRFELVHDIDVSHVLQNVRFRYAAAEARPTDVALTEAWIVHPPQDSLARIVLFLSPAAGNNGVYEIVVPHAYTTEGVRAQWLLRARDALAPETCNFVPETVRWTLWSRGYFANSVQLTFAPDADLELKQVVVLPRARSDDPSAYGVAARLRGTVMVSAQNYVFEIGLFVEAATCQGVKLHTDEGLPAHVRSLHTVFESLLQDETLLFAERENGAVALVLYDKIQKQLHEHVVHVRLYSGETHNRLEMYLNRSDTHWRVASQGFQAVLDGMPKSVVSSSYRVSARYAQTAVYSRVLTRANDADHNWLLVATDMDRLTSSANWYNTYEFEPGAAPRQLLLRRQPLMQAVPTEVDRRCNYLDCTNCATNELQTLCFVAQRCVMARCVGAVVNTNNVFCAVGILLREVLVLQGSQDGSVYVGVVEVFTTIVRQYFSPQNGVNTVALQSISNLYTTVICDVKNVLAALSALLPAYFYTLASMVNALPAVGSAMLAGGNNAGLDELVRVVSPRRQIEAATATFASTQLIFQVSLGLIFTMLRDLEIGMCLLSKYTETIATVHAQFLGPRISIVRNFAQFLFDENQGGDICEVLVQRDIGYASQRRTQAQEEAYIFELIRDGGAAAVSTNHIVTRGFDLQDITDSLSSLISAQVGLFRTYAKLKFSYFIKWLIGVTYGITGVMIESQRDICTPQVRWSDAVLQCACGDAAYMVPPEHAGASLGWCTGVLVLADEDGEEQTVHNPYSYAELVQHLGPHLRPLLAAINEHGQASAQARGVFAAMRASIPNLLHDLGNVPPVSVLMRCRDNYANKRWDRGVFELFAAGASPERTAAIEYVCAQHAAPGDIPGVCGSPLANQALVCLHAGAGVNTIEACTQLVFPDLEAYFRYAPDPRVSSAIPAGPDACRLATGSALQSSAALAPCMHHDTFASQCANSAADASTCDVNLAVHVHNGVIGILPADGYAIDTPAEQDPARVHARHRSLRDCILAKLVTDVSASITEQLTDFDLRVVSSEGDELHEVVDCSYLGGAASVDLLPNDPGAAVENMHFARPVDPAACNGSAVTDLATGRFFREKTCGSPARVAVLTHIKHALTASNDNTIRSIVRSRLEDIVRNVSDLAMYACGDPVHPENVSIAACCPGGTCSADADYSPAVVTDTVIDFADIANSINFGGARSAHNVFTASMLDPEFWTRYQTPEGNASLRAYADEVPRRRATGVAYAVNGTLDDSEDTFAFPLTREPAPLSLAAQCHGLLRASMPSMHLEDVEDRNAKWLTLPLIRDMLDQGAEWRPLDRSNASTHTRWPRAQFVHNLLTRRARENMFELLVDDRLVPQDSRFCSHDSSARSLGGWRHACPCGSYVDANHTVCSIDRVVCDLSNALPVCLRVPCAASDGAAAAFVQYHVGAPSERCLEHVRAALRVHGHALTRAGFTCPSLMPASDHSELDDVFFVRNGISNMNREHVRARLHTTLGEHQRTVDWVMSADDDTRVDNVLCERDLADLGSAREQRVAKLAFPRVSMLAEAPATAACLAFVMETAAGDILRYEAQQANVETRADVVRMLADSDELAARHHKRCNVQLARLRTCHEQGAYANTLLSHTHAQPPTDECPHHVAPWAAGTVFVVRDSCLVVDNTHGEARARLYDGFCVNASTGGLSSQALDAAQSCRVADPRDLLAHGAGQPGVAVLPALRRAFVLDTLNAHAQAGARTHGVLGAPFGNDWLFPTLPAREQQRASVPYWPPWWQGPPYGEALVDEASAAYGGGFSSYVAYVEDEHRFVVLPDHLRNATQRARLFGSAHYCRENTFALPMPVLNTYRMCVGPPSTSLSSDDAFQFSFETNKVCSDTAEIGLGGGAGDTIGDWWPLFRAAVVREAGGALAFSQNDTQVLAEIERVIAEIESHHVTTAGPSVAEVFAEHCKRKASGMPENAHIAPGCYANSQCPPEQMCSSSEGECVHVTVEVRNELLDAVEVGASSRTCAGQGKGGASPWELVDGLLHAHGLCAHANTVANEYIQKLFESHEHTGVCTAPSATRWSCANGTEWHWVRQVPPVLDERFRPGMSTEEYEALGYEWDALKLRFLRLEPHLCDHDYIADSQELKMCKMSHVDAAGEYAQWMRTSAWRDETIELAQTTLVDKRPIGDKLRFLGLLASEVYQENLENAPAMQTCRSLGLCGIQLISVGGIVHSQRWRDADAPGEPKQLHSFSDLRKCGAMGYPSTADITHQCILDRHVTALYHVVFFDRSNDCRDVFAGFATGPFSKGGDGSIVYPQTHTGIQSARDTLNALFVQSSASVSEPEARYEAMHECALRVHDELDAYKTLEALYDGPARVSGLYYFFEYGAYEVPLLWWVKLMWHPLFYPEQPLLGIVGDQHAQVIPAFDTRKSISTLKIELQGNAAAHALRDIWAKSTLRAPHTVADPARIVSNMVAFIIKQKLVDKKIQYRFACPKKLLLQEYEKPNDRSAAFENVAFAYEHQDASIDAAKDLVLKHVVPPEAGLAEDQYSYASIEKNYNGIVRQYEDGFWTKVFAVNEAGLTDSYELADGEPLQDAVANLFEDDDMLLVSPFDAEQGLSTDHVWVSPPPERKVYLRVATFNLPAELKVKDDRIKKAVSDYAAATQKGKEACFGTMHFAPVAPQKRKDRKCVFGPTLRSRVHEGTRTGVYVTQDSNPELTMKIQNTIKPGLSIEQSVSLCQPKAWYKNNDQRDCAHPDCERAETGYSQARCSFHHTWTTPNDPARDDDVHTDYSLATSQKLDDDPEPPYSCRKQTAQSVRPSKPELHRNDDKYIALAKAHLGDSPNTPETQSVCYRIDSRCLHPNPDTFFFHLNPLNEYIYDDVYRRVVQNANVGTQQQELYDAWYAQAGSVFRDNAAAPRQFMQREGAGTPSPTQSRVLDVAVAQSLQGYVKVQKYTLNKEDFPNVTYAHLTTKDRVLYEVRRGTARQYVFGHATGGRDRRVLAAPVRSFCPRVKDRTEYMHHWKKYTPESNVRIDKPVFAAELKQSGVSTAGSQLRVQSSEAREAVSVWQELLKFLYRKISFAPTTENDNAYAPCKHVNFFSDPDSPHRILRLRLYREKESYDRKICFNCKWKRNKDLTKLFDGTYDETPDYTFWPWYGVEDGTSYTYNLLELNLRQVADNRRLTPKTRDFCRSELKRLQNIFTCDMLGAREDIDSAFQEVYDKCHPAHPTICNTDDDETLDGQQSRAKMIQAGVCENVRTPSFFLSKNIRYDKWEQKSPSEWIENDDDQPIKEQDDLEKSLEEYYTFLNRSREATMLDLRQDMIQDSSTATPPYTPPFTPPCQVPRVGHIMQYTDLGACYEQDVHDTSNFENEPWWVESTCDMLRNFLDGRTHYNALRHWLDFRIPQHFSLSFFMHFFPDTEWIWSALDDYYPTKKIDVIDPKYYTVWNQNHDKVWTFDNYKKFLSNHLSITFENFGHVLANPRDRYWTENLVHLLMWFHVRDDSAPDYRENRNRLTACASTKNSRAKNIHFIQSNDYGEHCKNGGSQEYVITKPTLWAEMDGTSGEHMVPCSPKEAQAKNTPCKSILKEWTPNAQVVSFEVKLENHVQCQPSDTRGGTLSGNRVWVPVWGVAKKLAQEDSQALWKEVGCKTYDPAEVVLPEGKTGCLGCGLYRFGAPAEHDRNVQFISADGTLEKLKTDVRQAYDDISNPSDSSSDSMLSRLQTALASLENDKYIIREETVTADKQMCPPDNNGRQCYSLWMQVDKNKAMDEQIHEKLRATFTEFGQDQPVKQVCYEDPEKSTNCLFASFDANRARRASHALRMDMELNCQPPSVEKADLDSTVACASQIDGNASRLEELRNFVDDVYRHDLGLGVPTVKLNTAAVLQFRKSVEQRGHPSWEDGVHFFFADAERPGQQHLRRLLDRQRCRDSWGDTPVQERTCFKSQQERGTVATPWLGGNYSFPRVPYNNLNFIPDIAAEQRKLVNLGFDMCTMEGAEQVEQVLSMNLPFARACHAVDCLDDATLNETRLTLCEQLDAAGISGMEPESELPELQIRGIVAPILRPESVLLTHAPRGHCKLPLEQRARGAAPGARCTHTQAPLGFGVAQARGFAAPVPDFSGAHSMRARVKQHVLRMGRVPGLTGLWAGGSVLGEGVRADQFGYGLLARDPAQTGPHSIVLQVSSNAHMHVATVRLARNSTHAHPWVRDAHASVQEDIDLVLGSALYAPRSAGADAHWSCALTRAAAFALDEHFYARNPRLRLLTPDPVRMLDKYKTAALDGAHPFVRTETLRDAVGNTTRAYARVGPGFFMPVVAAGERLALAQNVSAYLRTLRDHLVYGTSLNNQVHAPGRIRVPSVDWPWLPKTLRSGEKHGVPVHVDLGKLLPGYSSAIKADGALRPDYAQTTLERGGDCHRGHVAQFTRAELDALLLYDECHTASSDKLACTRAGSGATHEFSLRWHPRTVTRRELRRAHFRFPARRHALNHTLEYPVRASRAATPVAHELSVGRSERVSPLHAVLRRAASAGMALDSDVRALWTRSLAARLDNAAWHARPGPAGASADFDIGVRGSGCTARVNASRWARGDRWGACVDAMSTRQCQVQNQVLDLCDIDELADMCAHLRQWRLDVARVNAAANGQVRVRARLYVPSAFESALGTFVGEIVQQTYKHHGAVCVYAEADAVPLTSTTRCFASEAIRLIDALKNLHDFAMQLMDMVFQYLRLQVQLGYVLCLSIMNAATGAEDTGAEFDTAISDFFTEVQTFISDVIALLPDLLNLVWILVQRTAGWIGIQEIMQAICVIIQVVSLIIHEIIVFLNRIPFVSDFFPDPAPYNTDICQFWQQPDYAADTHTYSTALLASHCLAATADISIPVDFWGSTYGSYACHASSFCTRDGGALTDDTAILCGRCASGVYGCDMAVSRCRCGMRSEQRATPCFTAQDCNAAGAVCSVAVEVAASFGTAACADTQGLRTCLYESGAAHSGACAVLPARTEAEYTDCETAGEVVTAEQVLFGEWCLASDAPLAGSAPSVHEDQTFALPCYLVSAGGAARRAKCAQVVFPQPARKWVVLAGDGMTRRRLLGAQAAPETELQLFAGANLARLPDRNTTAGTSGGAQHFDCGTVLAACAPELATVGCRACARVWWFWNLTLDSTLAGRDVHLLSPHAVVRACGTTPNLRRMLAARGAQALTRVTRDWLQDQVAWRALQAGLNGAFSQLTDARVPKHAPPNTRRRLLQAAAHAPPKTQRRLLQADTPVTGQAEYLQQYTDQLARLWDMQVAPPSRTAATAPAESTCSRSGVAIVDNILLRFSSTFKMRGYTARHECSTDERAQASAETLECPLFEMPFRRWLREFTTLTQYYEHMRRSGCLQNSEVSCLPEPHTSFDSVSEAIPTLYTEPNEDGEFVIGSVANLDPFSSIIVRMMEFGLDTVKYFLDHPAHTFFGALSLQAYSDDVHYEALVRSNTWTIGRVAREFLTCDFENLTTCARVRTPLHITIAAVFCLLVLVHLFFPIHPVLSFFLWTLGLTVFVPFFAYGFSPLCFPRIPNCLTQDLYTLARAAVPMRIMFPPDLVNAQTCSRGLVRVHDGQPDPMCVISCAASRITHMHTTSAIFFTLEPMLTRGNVRVTESIVTFVHSVPFVDFDKHNALKMVKHYSYIFAYGTPEQQHAVMYCVGLNSYTLIATYVVLVLLLPVLIVLLQYIVLAFLTLVALFTNFVTERGSLPLMPNF